MTVPASRRLPPKLVALRPHRDPDEKVQELHTQISAVLEHDSPSPRLMEVVHNMHLIAHGRRVPIPVLVYVDVPAPVDWSDADVEALEDAAFHQLWIERIIWRQ